MRTAAEIDAEVQRNVGAGIRTATLFLANRVKEVISVPAPRERHVTGLRSKNPGTVVYRATTPAAKGAAIRKLSGRARASIGSEMVSETAGRVGTNIEYAPPNELGDHPFLMPTLRSEMPRLATIILGS